MSFALYKNMIPDLMILQLFMISRFTVAASSSEGSPRPTGLSGPDGPPCGKFRHD